MPPRVPTSLHLLGLAAALALFGCSPAKRCADSGGTWNERDALCERVAGPIVAPATSAASPTISLPTSAAAPAEPAATATVAPPPDAAADTPPPTSALAAPGSSEEHVGAERYEYTLRYPHLVPDVAPLDAAMREFAAKQKSDFLDATRVPAGINATYPWKLAVDFTLASDGRDFASVLAHGDAFTGGAHGNPIFASFTLYRPDRRVIRLADLFEDPREGLNAVARYARRVLVERQAESGDARSGRGAGGAAKWIEDGTAPTVDNYDVFVVTSDAEGRATGLDVYFPPYQVAPYSAGPQQVSVPAEQIARLLKSPYREAFSR